MTRRFLTDVVCDSSLKIKQKRGLQHLTIIKENRVSKYVGKLIIIFRIPSYENLCKIPNVKYSIYKRFKSL